uniref:KIB1-4 beta-propeller domain-containing protein n=4 Tax=Aegilops tauschii TaxID=37682 RepID=A0A453ST37_AEGTS
CRIDELRRLLLLADDVAEGRGLRMAGTRSRRRRRARTLRQAAEPSPPEPAALSSREVAVVGTSGSTSLLSSGPHVCADLPDTLLHEIIALFNSFHDFLAFIGTCRSWRVAFSSFPSIYTSNFPPLHLKPNLYARPHSHGIKPVLLSDCKWKLSDPTHKNVSLCCSVPQNTPNQMHYLGCSYGYLIFSYEEHCLLVDVHSGTKVKPPKLRSNNRLGYFGGIGILTGPLSSPNSCLLLCSRTSMFEWQVGTNSWSEHPLTLKGERIHQIVFFKGVTFVMDVLVRLHTIHLSPEFSMQKVKIARDPESFFISPWLVVSGDMLLMLDLRIGSDELNDDSCYRFFEVFHLDFSVEPAKWVKKEKLENQALFVSLDRRNPAFACMSPERWGGKSNRVYVAKLFDDPDETWTAVEVGQRVRKETVHSLYYGLSFPSDYSHLASLWLYPSLVYGTSQ